MNIKVLNKSDLSSLQDGHRSIYFVKGIQILALAIMVMIFVIGMPAFLEYVDGHVPDTALASLTLPGDSIRQTAQFRMIELLTPAAFFFTGILLLLNPQTRFVVVIASLFMISGPPSTVLLTPLATFHPHWYPVVAVIQAVGFTLFLVFLLIFPNGAFVPRWSYWAALIWALYAITWPFSSELNPLTTTSYPVLLLFIIPWGIGLVAQIYRYRYVSNNVEKQQSKWILFGLSLLIVAGLFTAIPQAAAGIMNQSDSKLVAEFFDVALVPLVFIIPLALPLALAFSIFKVRLWDIDLLINKTLLYSLLILIITTVYFLLIGSLSRLFSDRDPRFVYLLGAGLIAFLFQPVRNGLQKILNRLTYGSKQDPAAILRALNQNLESTADPERILPSLLDTVSQTLRLPFIALDLKVGSHLEQVAYRGQKAPGIISLPLIHRGEAIGFIRAVPNDPLQGFNPEELELLETVTEQTGVSAHAVQLTRELKNAQKRLITIRSQERQRLRRDLHDSLGPQLAALLLRLETAHNFLQTNPELSRIHLDEFKNQTQAVIADIRRMVYDLRPPTLDQLGLVTAVEELAETQSSPNGLRIEVKVSSEIPAPPAAVEVAAYRICQEAMTNVVRHANANRCTVALEMNGDLFLEIKDDGIGLPADFESGIGLSSMRERATELGGSFSVKSAGGRGTTVSVVLPIMER